MEKTGRRFIMGLIVQKYGGTSVGNAERIRRVAERLLATKRAGHDVVAVISAMAGVTDGLIKLARELAPQPSEREMDVLLATGEQGAIALTAMAVNALGGKAVSLTGAEAGIVTDGVHTKAKISNISPRQINELLAEDYMVIVAGFQGQSPEGAITTLGRGGSDLTAIALAAALKADDCQIFTDVDGVYTCDPRVVPEASKIDEIAYDEMLEMAGAGSKVMQSRAVEFAKKFGVGFEVRSSLKDVPGTRAKAETAKHGGRGRARRQPRAQSGEGDNSRRARSTGLRGKDFLGHLGRERERRHDRAERLEHGDDGRVLHLAQGRSGARRKNARLARACDWRVGHGSNDGGGEAERRRNRNAIACRGRIAALCLSWGGRGEHPADFNLGDQDRGGD